MADRLALSVPKPRASFRQSFLSFIKEKGVRGDKVRNGAFETWTAC